MDSLIECHALEDDMLLMTTEADLIELGAQVTIPVTTTAPKRKSFDVRSVIMGVKSEPRDSRPPPPPPSSAPPPKKRRKTETSVGGSSSSDGNGVFDSLGISSNGKADPSKCQFRRASAPGSIVITPLVTSGSGKLPSPNSAPATAASNGKAQRSLTPATASSDGKVPKPLTSPVSPVSPISPVSPVSPDPTAAPQSPLHLHRGRTMLDAFSVSQCATLATISPNGISHKSPLVAISRNDNALRSTPAVTVTEKSSVSPCLQTAGIGQHLVLPTLPAFSSRVQDVLNVTSPPSTATAPQRQACTTAVTAAQTAQASLPSSVPLNTDINGKEINVGTDQPLGDDRVHQLLTTAEFDKLRWTCVVCQQPLSGSSVLNPCLHSICSVCVEKSGTTAHPALTCPRCDVSGQLPSGQSLPVDHLARNYIALRHLKEHGGAQCDQCFEEEQATARCHHCMENLCDLHQQSHRKSKSTNAHELVPIDDLRQKFTTTPATSNSPSLADASAVHRVVYCQQHAERPLTLFCTNCKCCLCVECTLQSHREHNVVPIDDIASDDRLVKNVPMALDAQAITTDAIEGVSQAHNELAKSYDTAQSACRDAADTMRTAIQQWSASIEQQLSDLYRHSNAELMTQKKSLAQAKQSLEHAAHFAAATQRYATGAEMMPLKCFVDDHLQRVAEAAARQDRQPANRSIIDMRLDISKFHNILNELADVRARQKQP